MTGVTSKTHTITEQYLERFGRVRVGIYRVSVSRQEPFSRFLNSLMITLRRKDLMPCYAWFSTTVPETRYLILWCNGYRKNDLSDITPIVVHLGALHYLSNITEAGFMPGDVLTIGRIHSQLDSLIAMNYTTTIQDCRSFGTSAFLNRENNC